MRLPACALLQHALSGLLPFLQGCHIGANSVYRGDIVATVDGVPSAEACGRECTAHNVKAGSRQCTVFNYCDQPGGCTYVGKWQEEVNVTLAQGQCESGGGQRRDCTLCLPLRLGSRHALQVAPQQCARMSHV